MRHYQYLVALLLVMALIVITGCASHQPKASLNTARWAEKKCLTRDCFMERLGKYVREEGLDSDGNQTIRWHIRVTKYRMQRIGEGSENDTRNYEYYIQNCWFTGTFDANSDLISTEWEGPGCYGKGR